MDSEQMAQFLRLRRRSLTPAQVGLPSTARRRTPGLRREEIAFLADISADYYTRLEQNRAPVPSPAVLRSLTRALQLSLDERDHLFRLADHALPTRYASDEPVAAVLMTILQRMSDIPVTLLTDLGHVIAHNDLAHAVFGEANGGSSAANVWHRWFVDPAARMPYPLEDHDIESRAIVADLHTAVVRRNDREADALVEQIRSDSPEFRALWSEHDVERNRRRRKRIRHPSVGELVFDCQILMNEHHTQMLILFEPAPETETANRLDQLSVTMPTRA